MTMLCNAVSPLYRLPLLLAGLALAFPATAQETDLASAQEQLQAVLTSGQQQFVAGDYEAAATSFSQVITASGGFQPGPLLLRAKAYAQLEEYEAALEDLKNALTYGQQQPGLLPEIQNTRAEVYMELGAFSEALTDLQAATKANRANAQYQFNLGKTYFKLGGVVQAEKPLTRYLDALAEKEAELEAEDAEGTDAAEMDEEVAAAQAEEEQAQRAEALTYRGQAYAAMRKPEKANADFEASLAIDPENHETYFGRATVALQDEDYATAGEDLKKSIEHYTPEDEEDKNPFSQAYLTLAFVQEELGKEAETDDEAATHYTAAKETCESLLALLPEEDVTLAQARSAALFRQGVEERLLGDYATAVKSFSKSLQLNPGLGEGYFRRGICFFYMGEERLAIRDFEQSASISYDSPRANLWKGLAWAKLGDTSEAIRAYGESLAVSDRYIHAYVNRGLAHLQQGDYAKAVDDFNEAIRLQPTEASHYYRRGRAYSQAGQRDKAIQSLSNAIAFDSQLGAAYAALATELRADGQWQLADEYRRRAAELGL